jgi:hypothetical protein
MVLRNMPLPVVEILFDEIRNYKECSSCGEVKLTESRPGYILDIDEDDCSGCGYYAYFMEASFNNSRKMPKYVGTVTPTEYLCHDCLAEQNELMLEEMDKCHKMK